MQEYKEDQMLKTATENWEIALKNKQKRNDICLKAKEDRLTQQEELEFIINTINSNVENGEVVFDIPFRISDWCNEVLISMLYRTVRTSETTRISC